MAKNFLTDSKVVLGCQDIMTLTSHHGAKHVYHMSAGIAMSLTDIIAAKIEKTGPVSFRNFMSMALYHPEYGYYRQSGFPAGGNADFVTAPHTSRLFGAILANQVEEFSHYVTPSPTSLFTIVEMGAGAGHLAADLIRYLLEAHSGSLSEFRYVIVEPFLQTREIQKATLGEYDKYVSWVDSVTDIQTFHGCFLSNELLDAFPVNVVQKEQNGWHEVYVDYSQQEGFFETLKPVENEFLQRYVAMLPADLPVPYRTEVNPDIKRWINEVSSVMGSGFLLTIDYGHTWEEYFAPYRNRGTLLGYYSQQVVDDVLQHPGVIDITSHVNFSDVAKWGGEAGFSVIGYAPQYAFLGGLDFENTFRKIYGEIEPFSPQMGAVKMLIMPQGMGETHKVLIQSKGIDSQAIKLSGFSFVNHSSSLSIKS